MLILIIQKVCKSFRTRLYLSFNIFMLGKTNICSVQNVLRGNADDHHSLPIFRCLSRRPGHLRYVNQPMNPFSARSFQHFRADFITTCKLPTLQCFDS